MKPTHLSIMIFALAVCLKWESASRPFQRGNKEQAALVGAFFVIVKSSANIRLKLHLLHCTALTMWRLVVAGSLVTLTPDTAQLRPRPDHFSPRLNMTEAITNFFFCVTPNHRTRQHPEQSSCYDLDIMF